LGHWPISRHQIDHVRLGISVPTNGGGARLTQVDDKGGHGLVGIPADTGVRPESPAMPNGRCRMHGESRQARLKAIATLGSTGSIPQRQLRCGDSSGDYCQTRQNSWSGARRRRGSPNISASVLWAWKRRSPGHGGGWGFRFRWGEPITDEGMSVTPPLSIHAGGSINPPPPMLVKGEKKMPRCVQAPGHS
jgi:hypothetical protein